MPVGVRTKRCNPRPGLSYIARFGGINRRTVGAYSGCISNQYTVDKQIREKLIHNCRTSSVKDLGIRATDPSSLVECLNIIGA